MSSAGITGLLDSSVTLDGSEVGDRGRKGDTVKVGGCVGCKVGDFVGRLVMSKALHDVPP
jgi:hypothetical protein